MKLNYATIAPEGYKALLSIYSYLGTTELSPSLLHILYLRISQVNGCPYCVDLHWKEAIREGIDSRKLNAVAVWRHMPFFDDKEKAALALAEAVTLLKDQQVPADVYDLAQKFFSEKEMTDLTFAIAHMNMLNRVAITFHKVPEK